MSEQEKTPEQEAKKPEYLDEVSYTLAKPIEHKGKTHTELTFRWPNGSDMEAMGEAGNEMTKTIIMSSRLNKQDLPRDVFESDCHGKDILGLSARLSDFLD